jgi:hypothetical protein
MYKITQFKKCPGCLQAVEKCPFPRLERFTETEEEKIEKELFPRKTMGWHEISARPP